MKLLLLTLLAMISTLTTIGSENLPFAYTVSTSHKDLGFIAKGRLIVIEFLDQGKNPFGKLLIYFVDGEAPLIIDGSLASLEHVFRSALPGGLPDAFQKNQLAAALLAMATNGRTYLVDQKAVEGFGKLKLEGQSERQMRAALQVVSPPILKSNGESWDLKFNYFTKDGRIFESSYVGEAHPFSIKTNATKVIKGRIPPGVLVGEGQVFKKEE